MIASWNISNVIPHRNLVTLANAEGSLKAALRDIAVISAVLGKAPNAAAAP